MVQLCEKMLQFSLWSIFCALWPLICIDANIFMNSDDSLRRFTMLVCDHQKFHIKCPTHTKIFIESATYGTRLDLDGVVDLDKGECLDISENGPALLKVGRLRRESCEINVHEKMHQLCQNQEECAVGMKIRQFFGRIGGKECKRANKMLKLVYKCKPSQFMSDNLCENTTAELKCRQLRHKIAIYSAHYGRTTNDLVPECDKTVVMSDCGTDVTGYAFEQCHGQYKCTIKVNDASFNVMNPGLCPVELKKALHLIHMCVDEKIFNTLPAIVGDDSSFHRQWYPGEDVISSVMKSSSISSTTTLSPSATTRSYEQINPLNDAAFVDKNGLKFHVNDIMVNQTVILVDFSHEAECSSHGRSTDDEDSHLCLSKDVPNFVDILAALEYTIQYVSENKGKALVYFCLSSIGGMIFCLTLCGCFKICALLCHKDLSPPLDEEKRIATVDLLRPLDPLALTMENYADYEPPFYATANKRANVPMRPYRSFTLH